jgi:hypothetical protein
VRPFFRAPESMEQVGREHLQRCVILAAEVPDLWMAVRAASHALSPADIRRAGSSEGNAARLLNAIVEASVEGLPPGSVASLIFHASVFNMALHEGTGEPLVSTAGEDAALDLNAIMLAALESGQYDFILGGGGDMLGLLAEILGQTYYKALVTGFRLAALTKRHRRRSSALEDLDAETLLEAHRMQMRELLPTARQENDGDEGQEHLLDLFEQLTS